MLNIPIRCKYLQKKVIENKIQSLENETEVKIKNVMNTHHWLRDFELKILFEAIIQASLFLYRNRRRVVICIYI